MSKLHTFIACLALPLGMYGQTANNLAVDGTVKDETGVKIVGATVQLYQDGALINKVITGKNGRFDLFLDFDHEYIIEVGRTGYVKKRLYLNTKNVPKDEQLWGYEYGGFIVDLLKDVPGIDFSILDKPIGKVYYDPNVRNFVDDRVYTKEIRARLEQLQRDYEEMLKNEQLIAAQREKDYQVAMADAQASMLDGDLLTAKENYLAASSIKPTESLPKSKVAEIDKQLALRGQADEQYQSLLSAADQLFGTSKYAEAKAKYKEASALKSTENYPKTRMAECDKRIAEAQAKLEAESITAARDRKYLEEIQKADGEFKAGNYQNAKINYQNALNIKPGEKYPTEQIVLVDAKLKESALTEMTIKVQAEKDAQYGAIIDKADAAYQAGNFENSKTLYEQAQALKTEEKYPADQLALIAQKNSERSAAIAAVEEQRRKDAAYKLAISEGDKLMTGKSYAEAKSKYTAAKELKPEETYANAQLQLIERLLNEMAELSAKENERKEAEARYTALIARADAEFKSANYVAAKASYTEASSSKPDDPYPKAQLSKLSDIEKRLALEQEEQNTARKKEEEYESEIFKADSEFKAKGYAEARSGYERALQIKPSEKYPKDQIMLIASKVKEKEERDKELANKQRQDEEQSKLNNEYSAIIAQADEKFGVEDYSNASGFYRQAMVLKPSEVYPKNQLASIERKLKEKEDAERIKQKELADKAEEDAINIRYKEQVEYADQAFAQSDWQKAKTYYSNALALRSNEAYPKDQLSKIDETLAALADRQKSDAENRQRYNDFLREGDLAVASKSWNIARKAYQSALDLFPNELIPTSRLNEIDELERRHEEEKLQAEFSRLVTLADRQYLEKDFTSAIKNYQDALALKADDAYVKDRIERIQSMDNDVSESSDEAQRVERTITEEEFDEGKTKVTIRKVSVGEKQEIYKRVVHPWGGKYYFLNDRPITELVWNKETTK